MNQDIANYNNSQSDHDKTVCDLLAQEISHGLPAATNKIWHGHPVWFLDDNPTVGYSKQKAGIRLMFWSGADFDEPALMPSESGKFKDASIFYNSVDEIETEGLARWLEKSKDIQWDYKNLIKNRGVLERLR